MPSPGILQKKCEPQANQVLAEQIFDSGHNARMRQNVVNAAVAEVRRADGIAIAARGERLRQEFVKVMPDTCYLFLSKIRMPAKYPSRLNASTCSTVSICGRSSLTDGSVGRAPGCSALPCSE